MNANLEPYELGKYSYDFNLLNLLYPIFSISIYSAYLRFEVIYDKEKLVKFVLATSLMGCILFCIVIFVLFDHAGYIFFALIIIYHERTYLLRAQQNIAAYNLFNVLQKAIFFFLIVFLANSLKAEDVIFLLGLTYFLCILLMSALRKKFSNVSALNEKSEFSKKIIIRFCLATTAMTLITWVASVSDQFFIKHYFGYEQLAPYAVAFRTILILSLISGVFIAYYPTLYYNDLEKGHTKNIYRFRSLFLCGFAAITIGSVVFADCIYLLFGAKDYLEFVVYFKVLVVAEFFRITASIFFTFKTFKLQQGFIVKSLVFIASLNIALNFIFIESYGAVFAAYSTLVVYLIYFALSLFSLFEEYKYIKTI